MKNERIEKVEKSTLKLKWISSKEPHLEVDLIWINESYLWYKQKAVNRLIIENNRSFNRFDVTWTLTNYEISQSEIA